MHKSPARRISIDALAALILTAGFGLAAIIAVLLIVGAANLGQGSADPAILSIAAAVVAIQAITLLLTWWLMQRLVIRRLRQDVEARAKLLSEQQATVLLQLRESAAQEERNRLARDLHDTIKQQLFSINVAAATAQSLRERDPEGAAHHLQHVRDLAQAAMAEMKALLTHLHPQPLVAVGLIDAIREQLEALRFRAELVTELQHDPLPDEERLPPRAQETIFRIVQEALSNIARHARARHARVSITQETGADRDWLLVCIEDDGQGFDPVTVPAGMGLTNMRARVEALGGRMEVESQHGKGATVRCRVPLIRPEAQQEQERRMKEEQFQQVYGASGLTSLAATALLVASVLIAPALMQSQTGESRVWAYLAGAGVVGAIVGVPLVFASLNWRRHALNQQPFDSIWKYVMYYYDTGTAVTILTVIVWTAISFRMFLLATVVLIGVIMAAIFHLRLYRLLAARIQKWATVSMLRARLREQVIFTGIGIVFVIMVYAGLFGPLASVRLFHDTFDQAWFVSFLAIVYPFLTLLGALVTFLHYGHLRRLETLEGTQPVARPMYDERLRQARRAATALTVGYHLLCVAIGALAGVSPPLGALIAAIAAAAALVVKSRVERRLSERIAEWTSLQDQQSALSLYSLFLVLMVSGIIGGIVGFLLALGGAETFSDTAAPTVMIWVIAGFGSWWFGAMFYLGMQIAVTIQRIRILKRLSLSATEG